MGQPSWVNGDARRPTGIVQLQLFDITYVHAGEVLASKHKLVGLSCGLTSAAWGAFNAVQCTSAYISACIPSRPLVRSLSGRGLVRQWTRCLTW